MNRREMLLTSGALALSSLIPYHGKIYPTICDELNYELGGGFKPGVLYSIRYKKEFDTNAKGFPKGFFPLAGWTIFSKLELPKPVVVCNYSPNSLEKIPENPDKDFLHFISWPYNTWIAESHPLAYKIKNAQSISNRAEEILNSWL